MQLIGELIWFRFYKFYTLFKPLYICCPYITIAQSCNAMIVYFALYRLLTSFYYGCFLTLNNGKYKFINRF